MSEKFLIWTQTNKQTKKGGISLIFGTDTGKKKKNVFGTFSLVPVSNKIKGPPKLLSFFQIL